MKYLGLAIALLLCVHFTSQSSYAQCSGGKINGIYHTSCYPWDNTSPNFDGYISGTSTKNDTKRLQRAITAAFGKLVFDETDYFLNDELIVYPYRTLEGTGRATYFAPPLPSPLPSPTPTPAVPSYLPSKLIQTANNKAIFRIGENITAVAIRDLALTRSATATGTIGILAQGGNVNNYSSFYMQFSNLTFNGLHKGIYVNAVDNPLTENDEEGLWQFDNVRMDHCAFEYCTIGVHINSNNSGWNVSSISFLVPEGDELPKDLDDDIDDGNHTIGMYLERSTYTTMDLLIGNGDYINAGPASAFIYVKDHANLSIRGAVDEGFHNSIFIRGGDRSSPIHLDNNFIQSKLTVNDSTVVSTGNQFYSTPGNFIDAVATGGSQIFSYGDKFCLEGHGCPTRGYIPSGGAQVVTSVNGFKASSNIPTYMDNILSIAGDNYSGTPLLSVMAKSFAGDSLLRLGRGSFWFDVTRSETDGSLTFKGNQNDYSRYTFDTANGGKVQINNDGSVTYGTVAYSALGAAYYTTQNGTVVYCSNCTKSTPCGSGGSGALAKRINGSWDCD